MLLAHSQDHPLFSHSLPYNWYLIFLVSVLHPVLGSIHNLGCKGSIIFPYTEMNTHFLQKNIAIWAISCMIDDNVLPLHKRIGCVVRDRKTQQTKSQRGLLPLQWRAATSARKVGRLQSTVTPQILLLGVFSSKYNVTFSLSAPFGNKESTLW